MNVGDSQNALSVGPALNDGQWHHIAVVLSQPHNNLLSDVRLYVDGVETETVVSEPDLLIFSHGGVDTQPTIGAPRQNWAYWKGGLDEVSMWGRALNSAEVGALRNGALSQLQYDALAMESLFDLFNDQTGFVEIAGSTWMNTTGLNGAAGDVIDLGAGMFAIVLDDSGGGVATLDMTSVLVPSTVTVTRGTYRSGDGVDLAESDDSDFSLARRKNDVQARASIEVSTTSPFLNPQSIEMTVEGSVFSRGIVVQSIELFDFELETWIVVDSRNASRFSDATVVVLAPGMAGRFVEDSSGQIRGRLSFLANSPRALFTANVDQLIWTVAQ